MNHIKKKKSMNPKKGVDHWIFDRCEQLYENRKIFDFLFTVFVVKSTAIITVRNNCLSKYFLERRKKVSKVRNSDYSLNKHLQTIKWKSHFHALFSSEESLAVLLLTMLFVASLLAESEEIWSRLTVERCNTICTELEKKNPQTNYFKFMCNQNILRKPLPIVNTYSTKRNKMIWVTAVRTKNPGNFPKVQL